MRRAAFMCIALAMGIIASPVPAQETALNLAPAPAQPPPFPHYPARAPREHDPNYHPKAHAHRAIAAHHRASTHRRARAHHQARKHRTTGHVYFSKRTIRQCHRMSYSEIMRYKNCRIMMRQDLAAAERARHAHRSTRHHAVTHRKAHRRRG